MRSNRRDWRGITAVLALPLFAAAALTGCGSGGDDASGTTTITVSNWNDSITPAMVSAFEEVHPEIKLNVQSYPGDSYSEKITTMITGGKVPDVMLLYETDAIRLSAAKQLVPLDDYLQAGGMSSNDFIPAVGDLAGKMGGTYGLPWCYATQVLFYNKDLFDAAGIAYPTSDWTWDDYRSAANATSSGTGNDKIWGASQFSFAGIWYSLAGQAGDDVIDGEGNLVLGNGMKRAIEFTNELVNVDKVQPQPNTSGTDVTDLFGAGKAAMSLNGSWAAMTYKDADFNWDIAPMPKDKRQYTNLHTGFFTIANASKKKDAAWAFIDFMMSKEGQDLISAGTNNPSAITAYADSTAWQQGGKGGPSNWAAITDSATGFGQFGYTLAPATLTNDLETQINSYLLGATSLDDVMARVQAANGKQ